MTGCVLYIRGDIIDSAQRDRCDRPSRHSKTWHCRQYHGNALQSSAFVYSQIQIKYLGLALLDPL